MSNQPPPRRASMTSSTSQKGTGNGADGQLPARPEMPLAPRQTSASMFTTLAEQGSTSSTSASSTATYRAESGGQTSFSPGSVDRVFPIRSAVSIDPTATPMLRNESSDGFPGMKLGGHGTISDRRRQTMGSGRNTSRSPPRDADSDSLPQRPPAATPRRKSTVNAASNRSTDDSGIQEGRRTSDATTTVTANVDNQTLNSILSDDGASIRSEPGSSVSGGVSLGGNRTASIKSEQEAPLVTARFKHVVTDGGHAVITGRDGETLQRCEDEPIHIPGAVQSFGLLVAFHEENGKLIVHVVSENASQIIGYTPAQLFKLDNFLDIFTEEQADNLLDHLDFIRDEEAADVVANGPEVFMISVRPPQHRTRKLWCAMHISQSNRDMVVCEFEIEDDTVNPLVPAGEQTPEPPEDTLGSDPTPEELAESTVNISRPLRVLRSARKKRGEAAAMEVFNIMSQIQEQLANAPTLAVFLKVLIGVVKELSGFHRVMIYQFDQAWNGRVVAELVDPRATKDLYKGLNFPASDIPRQARELYKVNKVRLLYDRDQETSRLVCRTIEDLENPLDLTHAYLRAMSPIHLKYLGNMAVRASMSISINAFNELWGLIACHTYGARGMRVSFPIRKMCRLVGDTASRNIERLSYASRLQARKLINTTSSTQNPSGYIVASSEDLLQLFDADVGALSIRDETKVMGNPSGHLQEILAMVEFLRMRKINSVFSSQDIAMDLPDLKYSPGMKFLAGLLFVPLSTQGGDFIVFFRRGVLQEVKWAGNPYEKFVKEGTEGYLEPRKSFKTWSEMIVGRCRDWTEEEIETASVLCLVYGKFIDVWRQKEAALQNSQLTRLLLANSAHEVRTPLNAIINYLEIALEGNLDQDTRDSLARSHSASKSLVYVINDLLDLTKTEENNNLVTEESFALRTTLSEATDPFVGEAKRKGIEYEVTLNDDLPELVLGDPRRVRQIVSNLIANAVQHTSQGSVKVSAWPVAERSSPDKCEVEICVEDTGVGMAQSKVDALFQELEEVSYEADPARPRLLEQEPFQEGDQTRTALGLGLAVVARSIRNMNGQLRLKTEEGKGSRFTIVLAFAQAHHKDAERPPSTNDQASAVSSDRATPTQHLEGEVTLVNRSTRRPDSAPMTRKESVDSMNSLASLKSGRSGGSARSNKSDADRLIDAIQEPLRLSGEHGDSNSAGGLARSASVSDPSFGTSSKTHSIGSVRDLKSALAKVPGQERVLDSGHPLKPVRVPDHESLESPKWDRPSAGAKFTRFEESLALPQEPPVRRAPEDDLSTRKFSVLVAEDDPINSKIMKKRLEKLGHATYMTVNGEECASAHGEQASNFDAILMDLQMPIVDGYGSTKMIRSFEKTQSRTCLSRRAKLNGRIPIFAVSASLEEREREKYIQTGFDGWLLKPVDFKRVDQLLRGIVEENARNETLYTPGKWEQGGWFAKRQGSHTMYDVDTNPSGEKPTAQAERDQAVEGQKDESPEGSVTPTRVQLLKSETV